MNISDKLNNISLILYGDEAEMSMTSYYLDYITAFKAYNMAFTGGNVDEVQRLATQYQAFENAQNELAKLTAGYSSDLSEEQKSEILKKTQLLMDKSTALQAEMTTTSPNIVRTQIGGYSDEQKAQILESEKLLYASRDNLLKLFAMCLKMDDRETNAFTFEELKKWSKKEKESLIFAVATEPDNGMSASFLKQMEVLNNL